jgi:hypothetical protein
MDTLLRADVKKRSKYLLVKRDECKTFTMDQVAVLRRKLGVSMNKALQLDQFIRVELIPMQIFPKNLRETITKD